MDEQKKISEFAVVSLVLAIFQFIHIFNVEKSILAVVFGALALKRISKSGSGGRKLAIAGVILGVLGIIVTTVMMVVFFPKIMQQMQQQTAQK